MSIVTLPPETDERIRRWIETGRYHDATAVIDRALEALEAEERARFEHLRQLVLEGHNGPIIGELDDAMWDEIERKAEMEERLGRPIRPEVLP